MKHPLTQLDPLTRRTFIEKTAKTALGVSLLSGVFGHQKLAKANVGPGKAKHVIYLFMDGGISHLDTFDPKTDSEVKGPTTPISTSADGVQIAHYLPEMAKQMHHCTIIRSMNSHTGVHESGQYIMRTAYNQRGTITHPSLGPWAERLLGKGPGRLPDSVNIGAGGAHPGAGFLPPAMSPIPINDPSRGLPYQTPTTSESQFDQRLKLMNEFDTEFRQRFPHDDVKAYTEFYDETLNLLRGEDMDAFDLTKEPEATRTRYGNDRFARGCLLARRLVQHGVRFIEVSFGGWDMHNQIDAGMSNRAPALDHAMATLIADLDEQGLLDQTLVVLGSEFGRTPRVNQNAGRDHHPRAFSTLFAGGGVKKGHVIGATDEKAHAVTDRRVSVQDFIATVGYGLGLDTEQVVYSPSGRPFTVGDKGQPVTEVFT